MYGVNGSFAQLSSALARPGVVQLGLHVALPAHQRDLFFIELIGRGRVETLEPGRVLRELAARVGSNAADRNIFILSMPCDSGVTEVGVKLVGMTAYLAAGGERLTVVVSLVSVAGAGALSTSGTAFRAVDPEEQWLPQS